jgi:hypothetical protein
MLLCKFRGLLQNFVTVKIGIEVVNDFRISWWLIIDVNSVLWLLHRVIVASVADVSEVQFFSIFV